MKLAIIEQERQMTVQDLTSAEQLQTAVELARTMIRECETRLRAAASATAPKKGPVPYL